MNAALSNTMGRSQSGFVYDDERVKVTVILVLPFFEEMRIISLLLNKRVCIRMLILQLLHKPIFFIMVYRPIAHSVLTRNLPRTVCANENGARLNETGSHGHSVKQRRCCR